LPHSRPSFFTKPASMPVYLFEAVMSRLKQVRKKVSNPQ